MTNSITVDELRSRMRAGEDLFILDVRQPEEHAAARICDGPLIPLGELPHRVIELEGLRDREIIVYCRSGARSGQAAQFLGQQGFTCTNVMGGIMAWNQSLG
ncbi:MAG: rhodanese-like domain-containing protein [Candidatus Kapaibacterium sp.]